MSGFKDKVVVITGAGGWLGKAHALEFGRRGAKVVVNDLGGSGDGVGSSDMADQVVAEIRAEGGIAIANKSSLATREGAKSIIDDAVSEFGTVDILVNNAGILRDRSFKKRLGHHHGGAFKRKRVGDACRLADHARKELRTHSAYQLDIRHLRQLRSDQLRRGQDANAGHDECFGH